MLRSSANEIVFLMLAIVLILHQPRYMTLFYRNRRYAPINHLQPWLMTITSVCAFNFAFSMCLIRIFSPHFNVIPLHFFVSGSLVMAIDSASLLTLVVFVAFHRVHNIAEMHSHRVQTNVFSGKHNEKKLQTQLRWIRFLNVLLQKKTAIIYIGIRLVMFWIWLFFTIRASAPHILTATDSLYEDSPEFQFIMSLAPKMSSVSVLLILLMSWKLRLVTDSVGMKRTLVLMSQGTLMGLIVFVIMQQLNVERNTFDLPGFTWVLIAQYLFFV